jgi:hypothetical protein
MWQVLFRTPAGRTPYVPATDLTRPFSVLLAVIQHLHDRGLRPFANEHGLLGLAARRGARTRDCNDARTS